MYRINTHSLPKNILSKFVLLTILLALSSCNGGRYFYYLEKDLRIKQDKLQLEDQEIDANLKKFYWQGDVSGMRSLGKGFTSYKEAREALIQKASKANIYKNRCSIILSYFFPLNAWDVWLNQEKAKIKALNKAIKQGRKKGLKGDTLEDVMFKIVWVGTPIISYTCIAAAANLK